MEPPSRRPILFMRGEMWGTCTVSNVYPATGRADCAHLTARPGVLEGIAAGDWVQVETGMMRFAGLIESRTTTDDGWERLRLTNIGFLPEYLLP